jgi:hypothetical protein
MRPCLFAFRLCLCISTATAAGAALSASSQQPLPDGFSEPVGGVKVAVVRVDSDTPQPDFSKARQQIEQQCRALIQATGAGTMPVFRDGSDQAGRAHTVRLSRVDGQAEVTLTTVQGYGPLPTEGKRPAPGCQASYGPSSSRFLRLRKLVDGRIHTWHVMLDSEQGTHTIGPRRSLQRLPVAADGVIELDESSPVLGQELVSGLPCDLRAMGPVRICTFQRNRAVPSALQGALASIASADGNSHRFRASFVDANAQIHESFFEPPSGIRYVVNDIRPAPGSSPDPRSDTSEKQR